MNAVIVSGGKQYQLAKGQVIKLESLSEEVGQKIHFDQVLMVADGDDIQLGAPFIAGAKVTAEVLDHGRHPKINIIKFRRRKHHMKRMGHRQNYTEVKVTDIVLKSSKAKTSEE
jgi:large subunit ribosomal protein L21